MQENDYQIIVALVNQGYSEEVMAAARPAGAAGGTVLHSRRVGAEEALSQWGFSLQEEKEAVMILAKAESKLAIMQAICDNCGLQSEAQGIVLSLPVDNVVGLGAEIATDHFQNEFVGKKTLENGAITLGVVKNGKVEKPDYQVDGISGGTITSVGVDAMLKSCLNSYLSFLTK